MKSLLFSVALMIIVMSSCKKESVIPEKKEHVKASYDIMAVGVDTSYSSVMYGRTNPPKYSAEDDYLKIQVVEYRDGKYTLLITNKKNYDINFQVAYEVITPTAISPNRKNSLYLNQVKAKKTETFYVTAVAKLGKIKIKALVDECDPEWLVVDLMLGALPVKWTSNKYEYKDGINYYTWSLDNPEDYQKFFIRKQDIEGVWYVIATIDCKPGQRSYKAQIWD